MNKRTVIAEYLLNEAYRELDEISFARMIELCGQMEDVIRLYNKDEKILNDGYLMSILKYSDKKVSDAQFQITDALSKLKLDFTFFDEDYYEEDEEEVEAKDEKQS